MIDVVAMQAEDAATIRDLEKTARDLRQRAAAMFDAACAAERAIEALRSREKPTAFKRGTQAYACYSLLLDLAQDEGIVDHGMWVRGCASKGLTKTYDTFRSVKARLAAAGWITVTGNTVEPVHGFL